MNILFVCTGNTCRSAMAAALLDAAVKNKAGRIKGDSAGTSAGAPQRAAENAVSIIRAMGGDLSEHLSKQVTPELLEKADLIITMEENHKRALRSIYEGCAGKLFTLHEYAHGKKRDVKDPYLQAVGIYKQCAEEIKEAVEQIVSKLSAVAIGCDHAGYALKLEMIKHLEKKGIVYKDFGADSPEASDYPVYAKKVANAVLGGEYSQGVLICGTGIGISIAANRIRGVRCALCNDSFSARAARQHNDANILAVGGRVVGAGVALSILDTFLETPFSEDEKHKKRINLID